MAFQWQEQHMGLFLEAYRNYKLLWKPTQADYRSHTLREKALDCMLVDLALPGLTVQDIKQKI